MNNAWSFHVHWCFTYVVNYFAKMGLLGLIRHTVGSIVDLVVIIGFMCCMKRSSFRKSISLCDDFVK